MVITTSAEVAASSAVAAALPPASVRGFSAAGRTSKAVTPSPALSRLRAMGPPMLPTPMNAMVVIDLLLIDDLDYHFRAGRNILDLRLRGSREAVIFRHRYDPDAP